VPIEGSNQPGKEPETGPSQESNQLGGELSARGGRLKNATPAEREGADEKRNLRKSIKEQEIINLLEGGNVPFQRLLELKHWKDASEATDVDDEERDLGSRYFDRALYTFKQANGGEKVRAAVFADIASGVYLLPDGTLNFTVMDRAIVFDWSEAHRLLLRIDAVGEQAREWWRGDTPPTGPKDSRWRWRRQRAELKRFRLAERVKVERQPHLDRAFGLLSAVLSAVNRENLRLKGSSQR
jgi:hypothetical protein